MRRIIAISFIQVISGFYVCSAQTSQDTIQRLRQELKECQQSAKRAEMISHQAQKDAERILYLRVVDKLAIRSTEVNDKELRALLALQAYNFNVRWSGYQFSDAIHNALCAALQKFGRLDRMLDDSADVKATSFSKQRLTVKEINSERLKKFFSRLISPDDRIKLSGSKKWSATVSAENQIRIWNMESLGSHPIVISEKDSVTDFSFSNDDSKIILLLKPMAKSGQSLYYHSWPLDAKPLAVELFKIPQRNLKQEEWNFFIGDGQREATVPTLPISKD